MLIPSELTEALPQSLKQSVERYWQDWCQACADAEVSPEPPLALSELGRIWACSEFVARLCLKKPQLLHTLYSEDISTPRTIDDYRQSINNNLASVSNNDQLMSALRELRQQAMLRIAIRDLTEVAGIEQILHELSDLAEAMVGGTVDYLYQDMTASIGAPMDDSGRQQAMIVLAMGKLGGRELNFSSDIDLMFCYAEEGTTQGARQLSNHEFFVRLAQQLVRALNETTAEGFVYRVDVRLRPYGDSGPLVMSFAALENYYQSQGREWERYAMIKARAITGNDTDIKALEAMLRPFTYRRYLDFTAFDSIREMKGMIETEVRRKGLGNNIKLGRGGIREIEFIGQTYQLLRGGREKNLQVRSIIKVLQSLAEMKFMQQDEIEQLIESYKFFRRLENRLQMERDQQTHKLPADPVSRDRIALSMNIDSWDVLQQQIDRHRSAVSEVFDNLVARDEQQPAQKDNILLAYWTSSSNEKLLLNWLQQLGYEDTEECAGAIKNFRNSASVRVLPESATQRLLKLLLQLLGEIANYENKHKLLSYVLNLLSAVTGRSVYLNLLLEYPQARQQMLALFAASPWFATQLINHPLLLDELLNTAELYRVPSYREIADELDTMVPVETGYDFEELMERLRQFHHAQVLKVAVLDVREVIDVRDVGDRLSNIAEVILAKALTLAWDGVRQRHGEPLCQVDGEAVSPAIGIVAYGKLGGYELGYSSDLDIVFVHNSRGEKQYTSGSKQIDNASFFSKVAQRVLHILSTRTYAGMLYETDIRLRPDGRAGLMVSSLSAFEEYQRNKAWTWEHQALLRARAVTGDAPVRQEFDRIRRSVLAIERDKAKLFQEVIEMRQKMRQHLGSKDDRDFNIKQDEGGLVDIEFIVQAGVLLNAVARPALLDNTSILLFIEQLEQSGWLQADESQQLVAAYLGYRRQLNRHALEINTPVLSDSDIEQHRNNVSAIWQRLMQS